ncbi:MAG: urease accessory protein UreD [Gammaproteobacteria bacterium]|nr:urease accessory protein UreD [Gammaproteobacteria bacterium]MCP5137395.1 urease accessory protein UreD [Gammaproteobacteria bacterium]
MHLPHPGWHARLELGFETRDVGATARTVLAHRRRVGPLSVQRTFHPEGEVCHVYLLHPPGGVVGGDRLDIDVQVDSGHALLTTPGATKFYRSAGEYAEQRQHLRVADGACLEWLPQETILFADALLHAQTRIDLSGNARLAAWEIQCFGRPTNAETFANGRADFRFEIWRDGTPMLLERLRVQPDTLNRGALLAGQPVTGVFVLSHADAETELAAREAMPTSGFGVTRVDDLLILRYLGDSTEQAQRGFRVLWQALRPHTLNRPACVPRIWAT